eukprot:1854430-Prymnesium_polylepis.1
MSTVPRLLPPDEWNDEVARLAEYVAAIRATASVFAIAKQRGCLYCNYSQSTGFDVFSHRTTT